MSMITIPKYAASNLKAFIKYHKPHKSIKQSNTYYVKIVKTERKYCTYSYTIQPTNIQTFKYVYLLIQTRKLANNIKVMG